MKSKYFLLLLTLPFWGCGKIDLHPTDAIDAGKAFRNIQDINLGAIGAYAALGYADITNTSLISDECMLPNENGTGGGVATFRWQYDGTNTTITRAFDQNYVAIDRLNRVLEAIESLEVPAPQKPMLQQYKAEMLALRGYCHFDLLANFASKYEPNALGVAYMTESKIGYPARLSFAESMELVRRDLQAAKDLMPATFDNNTRITLPAISAIQARVALYEKNWQDAIRFATEAIGFKNLAAPDEFVKIWKDESEAEVFWKLKKASADDGLLGNFYYNSNNTVLYAPAFKLMAVFDKEKDIRFQNYILVDENRGLGKHPYIVIKYRGGTSVRNLADVKLFRSAEMYLIRAEAYAETGDLAKAAGDLNTLRAARITGYTNESFSSKETFLEAVQNERYKELAFEGHRFFDLRRRNLPVERVGQDAVNTLGATLLKPTDPEYALPLPESEIMVNKNMVQNPGY